MTKLTLLAPKDWPKGWQKRDQKEFRKLFGLYHSEGFLTCLDELPDRPLPIGTAESMHAEWFPETWERMSWAKPRCKDPARDYQELRVTLGFGRMPQWAL
jgi:hypothetical protein